MNGENNMQEPQQVITEPKKKSKVGLIIGLIIVLCLIGVGIFFLLTKNDLINKNSDKEDTKTEEKKEKDKDNDKETKTEEKSTQYNGVYKKDKAQISIYCYKNNECAIDLEDDEYSSTDIIEIKNGKAKKGDFSYTFENNSVTINVDAKKSDDDNYDKTVLNGEYKKDSEYTASDYFKNNYGDPSLVSSKYNGLYELDNKKMIIFQISEEKARVYIGGEFSIFDIEFNIQSDGSLQTDFFDNQYKVTVENDKATFTTIQTDEEKEHDGTYTKTKTLTIEEILENVR